MDLHPETVPTAEITPHGTQKTTVYVTTAGPVSSVTHILDCATHDAMDVLVHQHLIAHHVLRIHTVTRILMNVSVIHTGQVMHVKHILEYAALCVIS
jgi:hypothetical protein